MTRFSSPGTDAALDALKHLSPMQRRAVFWLGFVMVLGPVGRFVLFDMLADHDHGNMIQIGIEAGVSLSVILIGVMFMVPPFGIWILVRVFRIKYLTK